MTPTHPLCDAELEANAPLLAAAILTHPLALQFASAAVNALATIAGGVVSSTAERFLLRQALAAVDLAEIEISRRQA